jgi:hypothetical protein
LSSTSRSPDRARPLTDHDRRLAMIAIWVAIAAGTAAAAELVYLVVRWLGG